jgi:hypothetical protein
MLTGQPDGARKHRQTIPPLATRKASYKVNQKQLTNVTDLSITYKLKSGAVPVNLVKEVADVGFDFGMSTKQVVENLVNGHQVIWEKQKTLSLQ